MVVAVRTGIVVGASVGDSACWMVGPTGNVELTQDQYKKRLGSGRARPAPFGPVDLAECVRLMQGVIYDTSLYANNRAEQSYEATM